MIKYFSRKTNNSVRNIRIIFLSLTAVMIGTLYVKVAYNYLNQSHLILDDVDLVQQSPSLAPPITSNQISANTTQHTDLNVTTVQELKSHFRGYDLNKACVDTTINVPRLCLVSLPKNFKQASISQKKKLFVKSLLPLILRANENILHERQQLLKVLADYNIHKKIKPAHKAWIKGISAKYRLKKLSLIELKNRIDVIPPSLALGQAIIETGWGTSHSALLKNSTFGLTVDDRVLSYDSLFASVENYMLNINAHNAYLKMRTIRSLLRQGKQKICSIKLLKGLMSYSIRKEAYLSEIKNIINDHNLQIYDNAKLKDFDRTL